MWNKFKEGFIEGFVGLAIALGFVYTWSWAFSMNTTEVAAWAALGIAAFASVSKR